MNPYKASFEDIGGNFDKLFEDPYRLSRLEAKSLDKILRGKAQSILDCSCGSGIQAVGLARLGYKIFASDISPKMVSLTSKKAAEEKLKIKIKVSDFLDLKEWKGMEFDAVINCGNSVPLVKDWIEISNCIKSMLRITKKGGLVIFSIHNYLILKKQEKDFLLRKHSKEEFSENIVFDTRNFGKKRVEVNNYFIEKKMDMIRARSYRKSYMYIEPRRMIRLMIKNGLGKIQLLDLVTMRKFDNSEWFVVAGVKN